MSKEIKKFDMFFEYAEKTDLFIDIKENPCLMQKPNDESTQPVIY